MAKQKTQVNLVDLKKELKGEDWDKMSKEERLKFCEQLLEKMFPKK